MDGSVTRFIGKGETVIPLLRGSEKDLLFEFKKAYIQVNA